MKKATFPLAASLVVASFSVQAQDLSLSVVAGTAGAGVDLSYAITPKLHIRGALRGLSLSVNDEYDDVDYEGDLNLSSLGVLADFYPAASWFRATAGLFANGNEINLVSEDAQTAEIGDMAYDVDGELETDIRFNSSAPYLGIGFGNPRNSRSPFSASLELGVLFQGSPQATLTARGTATELSTNTSFTIGDLSNAAAQELEDEIQKEEENLNSDIEEYKFYPVISLGLNYRF